MRFSHCNSIISHNIFSQEKILNLKIPTSKIIDETSTIKYETEETTTKPGIEDEVEHSTTQVHRHHTHRPHHGISRIAVTLSIFRLLIFR